MKLPVWLYDCRDGYRRWGSYRPLRVCLTRLDYGHGTPITWLGCIGRLNFGIGPEEGLYEGFGCFARYRVRSCRGRRSVAIGWEAS